MTKQERIEAFNEKWSYEFRALVIFKDENNCYISMHLEKVYTVFGLNKFINILTEAKEIMEAQDD